MMLKCNSCKGTKFKQVGNSVYCVSLIKGELCGRRLDKEQRKKYFAGENKKVNRRLYFNKYYQDKIKAKKFRDAVLVSEVALLAQCNRSTVYRNIKKFDKIKGTSPLLIELNKKVFDFALNN